MPNSVALQAQTLVRAAAEPVRPGATIKEQMNIAARALGYPAGHWRIRAAWKGEAGSWSAKAFLELRERADAWAAKQDRRKAAERQSLAVLYKALAAELLESGGRQHGSNIAQLLNTARALSDVAG